jgi:hypothetical protein
VFKERHGQDHSGCLHETICVCILGLDPGTPFVRVGHYREIGLLPSDQPELAQFLDGRRDALISMSDHNCRCRWCPRPGEDDNNP